MINLLLVQIIVISSIIQLGAIFIVIRKMIMKTDQLSLQNKLLTALQELDRAILTKSVTDIKTLSQEIVNLAQRNLGYFFVTIAVIDKLSGGVRRVAISETPGIREAQQTIIPIPLEEQIVDFSVKENLLVKAVEEKQEFASPRLFDIHRGIFEEDVSNNIQEKLKIKGVLVYPLTAESGVFGTIAYGLGKREETLSVMDRSIMKGFASEVSRSLDHVLLYQRLKEISAKLAAANEKLKDLDRLKDDFVSIASHELRTPMAAIKSYAWMALNRPDVPLTEKMKRYLSRTLISTERLINLVNDMLNISRIESGRIEISPKVFDMAELTEDVATEVGPKAAEKQLNIHVLKSFVPKVFADADKVHQVLLNLLGNSLKFTPENGSISISFISDGKTVEVSIKDSGVGIEREDIGRLFTKFGRLDDSYVAAATSGGTGLGLYICKSLIELMKGKIWANSEGLGRGTTFSFSLPAATKEVLEAAQNYSRKAEGEVKQLEPAAI